MMLLRARIDAAVVAVLLVAATGWQARPTTERAAPVQLAQEVYGGAVGEGDGPIGGPMAYGEPVGSPPLNSPMLYGSPAGMGDGPIGGPMLYGSPAGMGDGPIGGPMLYGAPVGAGGDNAPIGGAPLY